MATFAVELDRVTKEYGRIRAVDELSLSVPEGALFGLIGPNGAGKTTTFALLSGFIRPTRGEVRVRGQRLTPGHPPVGKVLALPQDAQLPERRRVLDTLVILGGLSGLSAADARKQSQAALQRVGLGELGDRRIGELSHGQRRRVGIAQTLVGRDEVLILDEPTAGLDPRTAIELGQLIRELARERTVLLSSHNLSELESLCTHAAILDRGRLVASGTMDEVKGTSDRVRVVFTKPLTDVSAVKIALAAITGVRGTTVADDGLSIDLSISDPAAADDITGKALQALIGLGAAVKGVERGQRLEQRFMEATGR